MTDGIARKGFDLDLKDGLEAENRLNDALRDGKIEVKSDKQAYKTENVFVEASYRGQPSGIMTTQANFWAFEIRTNTFLLIPTTRLRKIISLGAKRVKGGDFNRSEGYLIPISSLYKTS